MKNDNGVYYDIAILELSKYKVWKNILKSITVYIINFVLFSDRRIIFDFETYGDSPVCLNREKLLKDQLAITQGFGITETGFIPTNALETEVKVISNEECYNNLKTGTVYRLDSKTWGV